ncbi:MAG TPA: zf-HC2 domain-containing protein [Myxococcaceae bacterium]|jgi:anti-sigma factor (TIGR02949 family)
MTCQELDRLLYPYLDGEFQPEERMDMETHLAACTGCAHRVEQERQIQQALHRAARHSVQSSRAPASLRAGIQLGLKREQRRTYQLQFLRMSAAALVVVAVGSGWVAFRPEERQRYVEDAARRFKRQLPYEIANVAPEHVEAWFDGKLDHPVAVPRLPNTRVRGARLHSVQGRDAAFISYEATPPREGEQGQRIGVFVFDDARRELDAHPQPSVHQDSNTKLNVAIWRDDEVVYELVTELNEADILKMLQERERSAELPTSPRPVRPGLEVLPVSHVP